MRLVEKKVIMHPETWAPELLVTVAVTLEPVKDPAICSAGEAFDILGAKFVEILKTQGVEE